jgi:hypothetical protein
MLRGYTWSGKTLHDVPDEPGRRSIGGNLAAATGDKVLEKPDRPARSCR